MKQTQDEKEIWMSIIQMISFIGHSPELIHCDDNKEHLNPLTFSNEQHVIIPTPTWIRLD